ncbi:cysteine-rich secretory protein LCCL domain-containing 1 isoform X1 [Cricetulus griseus]|uniref:Cysteine-rich secretory protein LCCL domain containing 1 n=1 Tax=Cricetulus griseus TaxID=10029 RepID=A0A8C2N6U0_CRIGR|nr:cysteine-rich secretory protein LCCL domain-containing 1 isoform X1 [Cricetulus griseus]XP_035294894.1 cysteine-rich secretory protein LCCL domain-containing 1 isoform X1 [Cricetulus griseus]
MMCTAREWLRVTALLFVARAVPAMVVPNATLLEKLLEKYMDEDGEWWTAKQRGKRAITDNDMQSILDLHNKLRSQVYPTASNMEYMTWDVELERSAESWAETCLWEHGPANLLPSIGQNLGAHWGRYRPPTFHVQAWYDEVRDFSYPYEHECNPYCPFRCSGPVCTHYTQVVWATSSRIGCAINLCHNMNIWGQIWPKAVYLVCNYSPKGNWWGHAPYKHGRPCSACPPSFGGGCRENLCYKEGSEGYYTPREEETNEIERQQAQVRDTHVRTRSDDSNRNEVVSTQQMSQIVSCEVRLRDQCKGTTCNRYECPAGCLDSKAKVIGSVHYEMQSSICRAAIHYGIIDNEGGWVDVTRQGRKHYFIKSNRNGVQTIGKYHSANSFTVSKVTVQAVTCETTVEQLCPFHKPASHCPRVYCPRNCMQANPHYARVIGSRVYSDLSSICRAAVHAGVVRNNGGYVDVMPVDKRKMYTASFQNGIFSESLQNPTGGKAFRVFAVV